MCGSRPNNSVPSWAMSLYMLNHKIVLWNLHSEGELSSFICSGPILFFSAHQSRTVTALFLSLHISWQKCEPFCAQRWWAHLSRSQTAHATAVTLLPAHFCPGNGESERHATLQAAEGRVVHLENIWRTSVSQHLQSLLSKTSRLRWPRIFSFILIHCTVEFV